MNITIISPKNSFPGLPQFKRHDVSNLSFSLAPPSNVPLADYLFELINILGSLWGLIFGNTFLTQAVEISLEQLKQYIQATGIITDLCLQDIFHALRSIMVKSFRKTGYKDGAQASLEFAMGKGILFSCRKGVSYEWLFGQNSIVHAHSLTNPMQCQTLLIILLYWFYRRAKLGTQSNRIQHVLIIDDASRFVGSTRPQFEKQGYTSVLGHILAVLREAGIVVIFVTQLPTQIDPSALSLIRNIITIGNINGEDNLRVIKNCMSLDNNQTHDIVGFQKRETLLSASGSPWPRPIHGWTPNVELPANSNVEYENDYSSMIEPWHPLTEIPRENSQQSSETPKEKQVPADNPAKTLTYDCINYLFDKVRIRSNRLGFSIRTYEIARNAAVQNGYLVPSSAGKTVYLIPTEKAYELFGQPSPYKRNVSLEHSFYVQLAVHTLKQNTALKVQAETPIGTAGSTIDVATTDVAGMMTAYEITLSTSNLSSNAAKLQDTAYQKIVWLCRDSATANAVKAYFNKTTSLPPDLIAKFEYAYVSKFIKDGKA